MNTSYPRTFAALKIRSMFSIVLFSVTLAPTAPQLAPFSLSTSFWGSIKTTAVSIFRNSMACLSMLAAPYVLGTRPQLRAPRRGSPICAGSLGARMRAREGDQSSRCHASAGAVRPEGKGHGLREQLSSHRKQDRADH